MTLDDLIEDSSERLVETWATMHHTGERLEGGIDAIMENMRQAITEHNTPPVEFLTMLCSFQAQQIVLIVNAQDES